MAVVDQARVIGETGSGGMLDDEYPVRREQVIIEDDGGEIGDTREVVGRIGENDIEGGLPGEFPAGEENVGAIDLHGGEVKLPRNVLDKRIMVVISLDGDDAGSPARGELVSDATCPGEEIQDARALDGDEMPEDIKEVLLREIRCRTRLESFRGGEVSSPVCTAYNSHAWRFTR